MPYRSSAASTLTSGSNFAMSDGSVRYVKSLVDGAMWDKLLQIDDGVLSKE